MHTIQHRLERFKYHKIVMIDISSFPIMNNRVILLPFIDENTMATTKPVKA